MSTPTMGRPKKHFTEEALAQATQEARQRYVQHRREARALVRGLDRQIRQRAVAPKLPFYPVAQKHVRFWPPPALGSLAIVMAWTPTA